VRWIVWRAVPLAGQRAFLTAGHDITGRKRMEEKLREAHGETERLLSSIASILVGLDLEGRVTRWNLAATEVFGRSAGDALGRTLGECTPGWRDPDALPRLLHDCGAGPERVEEVAYRDARGRDRVLSFTVFPVVDAGRTTGLLLLGADVTERRRLESQLRQAQKLEGIGQLAAGIAHEINTPVQYVNDNVKFLQSAWQDLAPAMALLESLKGPDTAPAGELVSALRQVVAEGDLAYLQREVPSAVDQTLEGLQRVAEIVRAMKEFSHPGDDEPVAIDLNHAIKVTLTVARNEIKYVADVETDLAPDLPAVPCLRNQINQTLLNLLVNAAQAIEPVFRQSGQRGRITVRTRRVDQWAEVRIDDSGAGIPEAIRSRVFEPFFTTKEPGKGTGQGLALAYSAIVQKHRGQIWFESEAGRGTSFFIRLPLAGEGS
jgi:PAS domain S-box-containing protein